MRSTCAFNSLRARRELTSNSYTDSTGQPTGNPKFETCVTRYISGRIVIGHSVPEMFRRLYDGIVGIVSTAYISDATPAAHVAHTSQRSAAALIVEQCASPRFLSFAFSLPGRPGRR